MYYKVLVRLLSCCKEAVGTKLLFCVYLSCSPYAFTKKRKKSESTLTFLVCLLTYSHLSNRRGGWNKRGGGANVPELINEEVGINVEDGIFWEKLVHKSNKRGVEGGKI